MLPLGGSGLKRLLLCVKSIYHSSVVMLHRKNISKSINSINVFFYITQNYKKMNLLIHRIEFNSINNLAA